MTFTPDMSCFGVGLADGSLKITKNKEKEANTDIVDESAFLMGATTNEEALSYKYFFRGLYQKKSKKPVDDVISIKKTIKLSKFDALLKYSIYD